MSLIVEPKDSLMTEIITIRAQNLKPGAKYQLYMWFKHPNGTHLSWANFISSNDGTLDVHRDCPIQGTYAERNPEGLFQSMEPGSDVREGSYVPASPPFPYNYTLEIRDKNGEVLDSCTFMKRYQHPLVKRIEIEEKSVTGTLFVPPGSGPFPAIVDMLGGNGGLRENRGAMMASSGFVVLSLAYLGYKNLPKRIRDVDLEYFQGAIDWLSALPYVGKIGIQGNSFGGAIVHYIAIKTPKIKAVCSINGAHCLDLFTQFREKGKLIPAAHINMNRDLYNSNGYMCLSRVVQNMKIPPAAEFDYSSVGRDVAFRFVVSRDDRTYNSLYSYEYLKEKIEKHGLHVECDLVFGGHLIDTPHLPNSPYVFAKYARTILNYGGDQYIHGKNQSEVWPRTLAFFSNFLGKPIPPPDWRTNTSKL